MRALKPKLIAVLSLCCVLTQAGFAQNRETPELEYQEPWWGTWVNDTPGRKFIMEPWEDGIKMVSVVRRPNGEDMRITAYGRFDGKEYPELGNPGSDTIVFIPVDDRTYKYVGRLEGKDVIRATITFPPDGITRVTHMTYYQGQEMDVRTVWHREFAESDKPWFGTWTNGNATLTMEPWEDGFTLITNIPPEKEGGEYRHETAFGRFDGKVYHETGNPSADSLKFGLIDERAYWVRLIKDGKETMKVNVSFSEDGKTRVSEGFSPDGESVYKSEWTRVDW